jgi:hypothetical protein
MLSGEPIADYLPEQEKNQARRIGPGLKPRNMQHKQLATQGRVSEINTY